jgi:hypothetical protein
MELIFRVNIYNGNEESSDIAYSNTFEEFGMALESYEKESAENQDRMVELAIELKDEIIGDVHPILNSKKLL